MPISRRGFLGGAAKAAAAATVGPGAGAQAVLSTGTQAAVASKTIIGMVASHNDLGHVMYRLQRALCPYDDDGYETMNTNWDGSVEFDRSRLGKFPLFYKAFDDLPSNMRIDTLCDPDILREQCGTASLYGSHGKNQTEALDALIAQARNIRQAVEKIGLRSDATLSEVRGQFDAIIIKAAEDAIANPSLYPDDLLGRDVFEELRSAFGDRWFELKGSLIEARAKKGALEQALSEQSPKLSPEEIAERMAQERLERDINPENRRRIELTVEEDIPLPSSSPLVVRAFRLQAPKDISAPLTRMDIQHLIYEIDPTGANGSHLIRFDPVPGTNHIVRIQTSNPKVIKAFEGAIGKHCYHDDALSLPNKRTGVNLEPRQV